MKGFVVQRILIVAVALTALSGCKENRVPNGIISKAVDELKLSQLATDPASRGVHLDSAISDLELVQRDYSWSRPARFLREGGKFSGMTVDDMKQQRAALDQRPIGSP